MDPNSPEILTVRGLVLFLSGKLPQALQHVVSALKLDPGYGPALKLRKRAKDVERLKEEGNTAFKAGNLEEAVARYTATLEVGFGAFVSIPTYPVQRIGDAEEEGKGGQIRATLLSNRATAQHKVCFVNACVPFNSNVFSWNVMKKPLKILRLHWLWSQHRSKRYGPVRALTCTLRSSMLLWRTSRPRWSKLG